jgi:hypothetical protein
MKLPMFNVLLSPIALVAAAAREKPITPLSASTLSANPLTARQGLETQLTQCTNEVPNECGRVTMKNGKEATIYTGCGWLPDKGKGVSSFRVDNCYCTFWA